MHQELTRIRRAAGRRGLSVPEYLKQSAIAQADDDLGTRPRFEADPFERRAVESYPVHTTLAPHNGKVSAGRGPE